MLRYDNLDGVVGQRPTETQEQMFESTYLLKKYMKNNSVLSPKNPHKHLMSAFSVKRLPPL